MANVLGAYNPVFYANETLIHLRKSLGLAARVHRGYEQERRAFEKGDIIRIKSPSVFTAQSAPSSAQDLKTKTVDITLGTWKEVKWVMTDKERAYTGPQIMAEHIEPAAYALADAIDQDLAALYKEIPWLYDYGTQTDSAIIVDLRKVLFDNAVPITPGQLHLMTDSTLEAYFLKDQVFHSAAVAGAASEAALMRGSLGTRFGVECFANQNTPTHTPGTALGTAGDAAGACDGIVALGATSIVLKSLTGSETIKAGDTFVIAGHTQRYAVTTATVTLSSGAGTAAFTPPAVVAYADNDVVTFTKQTATAHAQQVAFHRNCMALGMAPLPDDLPGIEAFTAVDPVSGLTVRARRWADGANSQLFMAVDALYGVKMLDGNLGVRGWT
jgi:hypothetical protein